MDGGATEKIHMPFAKRFFDIVVSAGLLVLLSPLFAAILLLLAIEHMARGEWTAPPFYTETRISQGERFRLMKFNIFRQSVIDEMRGGRMSLSIQRRSSATGSRFSKSDISSSRYTLTNSPSLLTFSAAI